MKSTFHTFDVAIGRLDIVYTSESLIPEEPETEAPETEEPETDTPETEAPEAEAPVTTAPVTDAPEEKSGCGSSVGAAAIVVIIGVLGCALIKKH